MTWDTDSANDIQVKLTWSTSNADAVYLDYVKAKIYYTDVAVVDTPKVLTVNSSLTVNGNLTIK